MSAGQKDMPDMGRDGKGFQTEAFKGRSPQMELEYRAFSANSGRECNIS